MTPETRLVKVELSERSYKIFVRNGICRDFPEDMGALFKGRKCLLISDSNVHALYGAEVRASLEKAGALVAESVFPAGEAYKNIETVSGLYDAAAKAGLVRNSIIVALGGGVTGDIAGFVAATYMRGIDFVQIPTSLLAMVDSSVGGKTGIDLAHGKNLVGAFWQPRAVLIDTACLDTLPAREVRCGLAEIVKYGVIMDAPFFDLLEGNAEAIRSGDHEFYSAMIARCCQLKANIVAMDEKESSIRAILNYGHTFGHAIEKVYGYENIAHGEGVAIGMCMAAELACSLGMFTKAGAERQAKLLAELDLPVSIKGCDPSEILGAMSLDKKAQGSNIRFILPESIGKAVIKGNIDSALVLDAIKKCSL